MRIFHLSDLHIGIRLYNYDLREEQEYIFNEIIEKMQEYKPDVIVIAGDIYDRLCRQEMPLKCLTDLLIKSGKQTVVLL